MADNKGSNWTSGLAINLISNLIAFVVGALATYLSRDGSVWVKPLLCGGAAWLLTFLSILAFRFSKNLPVGSKPLNVNNVQSRIRDWLDHFNLTVQSVSDADSHFFYSVTTGGGKKVSILRSKGQFSDYVLVKGVLTATPEDRKTLESFTDDEKVAARLAVLLELSRAVMGYKSDKDVLEEITVFRRVPITPSLDESEVFRLMWEVEAIVATISTIYGMAAHKALIRTRR